MSAVAIPFLLPSGEGRVLRAFGEEVTILREATQTGGQFTLITAITLPGGPDKNRVMQIAGEYGIKFVT